MGAVKRQRPTAGERKAASSARDIALSNAYLSLSHRIDALTCASRFMHDEDVPCYDHQDRLAHAAGALYVEAFLNSNGHGCCYDAKILGNIVASWLHINYSIGHRIVRALIDAGLLMPYTPRRGGGAANE